MVRARAEAAGLRVFRAARSRVQKGARVQAVCHASHAVELGQEVCGHALGLWGQVARWLPEDAAEGAVGYTQHWRKTTGSEFVAILESSWGQTKDTLSLGL